MVSLAMRFAIREVAHNFRRDVRSTARPVAGPAARSRRHAAACRWSQRGDGRRGHPHRQRGPGDAVPALPERKRSAGGGVQQPDPGLAHPARRGSLRDRLVAVVLAQAEAVAQAPTMMTAMTWLALGRDLEAWPQPRADDSVAITTLRERIAQQYSEPFDVIFDSPEAAELGRWTGPGRSPC